MQLRKGLAIWLLPCMIAACGDNSTKNNETTTTDTLTSNQTTSTAAPATGDIQVPEKVTASFREKYPASTSANWSRYAPRDNFDWEWTGWPVMDSSDYMVQFNDSGLDQWAWYTDDNAWVGTVTTVTDYSTLPAAVNKRVSDDYPGYTITEVEKENDKNRTAYEVELAKGDEKIKALVSENGELIKKKTVTPGTKTKEKNK